MGDSHRPAVDDCLWFEVSACHQVGVSACHRVNFGARASIFSIIPEVGASCAAYVKIFLPPGFTKQKP